MGSFIKSGVGEEKRTISIKQNDPDLLLLDEEGDLKTLKIMIHNINVYAAAKALGIMAWHVIPENRLDYLNHYRCWCTGCAETQYKVTMFFQQILRVENVPTKLTLFQRSTNNKKLAPFIVGFVYEAFALTMPIPDNSFCVEEPQVPITNKLGRDNIQAGDSINMQAITSAKEGRESFGITLTMGP